MSKEYFRNYYLQNKEKIDKYQKEYREENKEILKEKAGEKLTCECGCEVRRDGLKKHKKTNKHKISMESNETILVLIPNIETLLVMEYLFFQDSPMSISTIIQRYIEQNNIKSYKKLIPYLESRFGEIYGEISHEVKWRDKLIDINEINKLINNKTKGISLFDK